jgi:D-serine deaminase-like pyridoxal phosphate-dependent protein
MPRSSRRATGSAVAQAEAVLAEALDLVRRDYGSAIGSERAAIVTPALVLDLPAARRNIATMSEALRSSPARIRPHFKTHKSVELARLQVAAGAIGLTAATAWEGIVLIAAGLDHVLVANEVVDPEKIEALARAARSFDVIVAVDSFDNVDELARAARAEGAELGALVDVDTGMHRCGVGGPDDAVALAERVASQPGLRFRGVTGYEGHCARIPERELRHTAQIEATARLIEVADRIERHGLECPIRSAGGTATWEWTANDPGITEIQAGSYVMMDNFHGRMVEGFESSLTVLASVLSLPPGRLIVNAGNKSMAMGEVATIRGYDHETIRFSEEHGIFATHGPPRLRVGDKVELIPGYSPGTVNWYDAYHVVDNDVVVDIWPVFPRGPGHHGLAGAARQTSR